MKCQTRSFIIGIDEVGRGPLAGPVVLGALAMPANLKLKTKKLKTGTTPPLRDSKKLTKTQREEWIKILNRMKQEEKIFFTTASVSPIVIDKINITKAANKAATMAYDKLLRQLPKNSKIEVFLDGGLHLNSKTKELKNSKTIIKGDEKIPAISLASIIAKVKRDKLMAKYSKIYPQYGFEKNVGYGTRHHIQMIKKYGECHVHRKTFLKNFKKTA